jgi:hypothetical protein
MENNILQYLDDPAKVAGELKEKHRDGARAAQAGLADHRKAEAERRKALFDICVKDPKGPINCQILWDAVMASDESITKIEQGLSSWAGLCANDVSHALQTWPTDVNKVNVLDNDLAYCFSLANRGPSIRENIKKLYAELEFEASELKRLGPGDELWTIPAMAPASETPRAVVVETNYSPLKH